MKPKIIQHSAGQPSSGGPATALSRLLDSSLAETYDFVEMKQIRPAGGLDFRLIWKFARIVRSEQPSIVHVRGLGNEGFHGALAARLGGARRVLVTIHGTVRDLSPHSQTWRTRLISTVLEPLTLRLAHEVATVCEYAAGRSFLDVAKRAGKFVGVVPNGVATNHCCQSSKTDARRQYGLDPSAVIFVVVGRVSVEKGLLVLADALLNLPSAGPPIQIVIVGDGPDRQLVEARTRETPRVSIRFLGQQTDVKPILAAADVFLFPTLHENMSNALLEAMSIGLPVIATAVGGNVEVLAKGGGILIPALDPSALAVGIHSLSIDDLSRHQLGQAGAANVSQNYSQAKALAVLGSVYANLLEPPR